MKFRVCYSMTETLTVDEIWPDGDAPENPTADDVRARIDADGDILSVIDSWNLDPYTEYDVYEDKTVVDE